VTCRARARRRRAELGILRWQSRPLDAVYAVIFIDAINVKICEGQVANRPEMVGVWVGRNAEALDGWRRQG
jgi:putative transposase